MDPLAKFIELLERAKQTPGIFDANGMTLSTVGADGRPSAGSSCSRAPMRRGWSSIRTPSPAKAASSRRVPTWR